MTADRCLTPHVLRFTRQLTLVLGLLCLVFLAACSQTASTNQTTFEVANSLYTAGNYTEAVALYEQLVADGSADARVYFNIGNSYFNQEDYVQAVLNYERARHLNPRDGDIRANLLLAEGELGAPSPDWPPVYAIGNASGFLRLNELAALAFVLWVVVMGAWLLYWRATHERWRTASQSALVLGTVTLLVTLGFIAARVTIEQNQPPAIVLTETQATAPDGSIANLFAGDRVLVLRERGQQVRVQVPTRDERMWISADSIAPLIPQAAP